MHPLARRPALGPRQWEEIRGWADRLEESWQRGADVDLTQFLPPPSSPLRGFVFEELIKTDLEIRWRRGLGVGLRNYLQRYPELSARPEALPGLLYEEYRVRQRFGDRPTLDSYREAYPDLYPAFQRLLEEFPVPPPPPPRPPEPEPEAANPLLAQQGNILPVGGAGYKLIQRIGLGGFGEVWRAEAPGGMPVALKFINRPLDQEDAQRELRSLEIIKELKSPFLLRTQAYWASSDRLIVVMDLADGSLRDRLKECLGRGLRGIPGRELLGYFREAAEALDYMHAKGVLHRDVKPDNILLREGRVLVADFGLVRQQVRQATLSSSGTPPYMAPEAWRGKPVNGSDQYSLACTWVELRLGRRPFSGDNAEVVIRALTATPDLEGLPPDEQRIIGRALAKDANDRYPTCTDMVRELERAVNECPELPSVPATIRTPTPSSDSGPMPFANADSLAPSVENDDLNDMLNTIGSANQGAAHPPAKGGGWQRDTAEMSGAAWKSPRRRKPSPAVAIVLCVLAALVLAAGIFYAIRPGPGGSSVALETRPLDSAVATLTQRDTGPATKQEIRPTVPVLKPLLVPAGFVAIDDEVVEEPDARYPRKIRSVKVDDPSGVFIYLKRTEPKEPASFYLMENKLSNALFRRFAAANPEAVARSQWTKGGYEGGKDLERTPDNLPVYRVTHAEAVAAAEWLGGRLPTPAELDMAAGSLRDRQGRPSPARGLRVNAKINGGPGQVNDRDSDDISPLGIRDLAGNGEEWTSETFEVDKKPVVVMRGRSYLAPGRLLYADLDFRQEVPPTQFPDKATAWTGFRVAVTPPRPQP